MSRPTPANYYDVVVVGPELAGAICAGLLARRGFRVLLIEGGDDVHRVGDLALPRDPRPLLGLESPALKRVLAELNMVQHLRRRITAQRPAYQLLFPDVRLDVGDDDEQLAAELARGLPSERERLDAPQRVAAEVSRVLEPLFGEDVTLPPDGFWARRELGRIEPRLPRSEDDLFPDLPAGARGRQLLLAPALAATDQWPVSPSGAARLFDLWRRGPHRLQGGWDDVRRLLLDRIRLHSGEVRTDLTARRLELRRSRVAAVVAGDAEERFGCGFLLWAAPLDRLAPLVEDGAAPKALTRALAALAPGQQRLLVQLVVRDGAIPEGLGETAFLLDADGLASLFVHPLGGALSVLSVHVLAPADAAAADLEALGRRVVPRLRALLPFLDEHLEQVVHAGAEPLWSLSGPGALGLCALPHDVGFKNVLLCGRQNLPGCGREGEFVTAWGAARTISASEKKRDLLGREVLKG